MKLGFGQVYSKNKRKIVIHHCHLINNIIDLIQVNDILFFDDCLYSQYVFIKNNIKILQDKNIICILGFSAALFRDEEQNPIYDIKSNVIHDKCNSSFSEYKNKIYFNEMNGFMTISEIKELLEYNNIYLACHGCCHLKIENEENSIKQIMMFNKDIQDAVFLFKQYNLNTNIFVYPYAFEKNIFNKVLDKYNFIYRFAGINSKRIEIESLI